MPSAIRPTDSDIFRALGGGGPPPGKPPGACRTGGGVGPRCPEDLGERATAQGLMQAALIRPAATETDADQIAAASAFSSMACDRPGWASEASP